MNTNGQQDEKTEVQESNDSAPNNGNVTECLNYNGSVLIATPCPVKSIAHMPSNLGAVNKLDFDEPENGSLTPTQARLLQKKSAMNGIEGDRPDTQDANSIKSDTADQLQSSKSIFIPFQGLSSSSELDNLLIFHD